MPHGDWVPRGEPVGGCRVCASRMNTKSTASLFTKRAQTVVPLLVLCGAIGLLAGCATEPESHVISSPPPATPYRDNATVSTTTTQTTQTTPMGTTVTTQTQPAGTIIVTQAPPALQTEVILAQPSSAHVWIAGYWTWRNNQYQWMAGHWEVPPYAGSQWVSPRWESGNGAYRFYEGHWN